MIWIAAVAVDGDSNDENDKAVKTAETAETVREAADNGNRQ
jgi:hypothetical protein